MSTPSASLCGFYAQPLKGHMKTGKKGFSFESLLYFADVETPPLKKDELYHVKQLLLDVLSALKLASNGCPLTSCQLCLTYKCRNSRLMEDYVLDWFINAHNSRCSRKQQGLLFIWCAGVTTSPLQLLAYRRLSTSQRIYVWAHGITLSSVLTVRFELAANFSSEIILV